MDRRPLDWQTWPWRWSPAASVAFFVACTLLGAAYLGPFLAHSPLGGFDWPKERFFYATLRAHLRAHGVPPLGFLDVPPQMLPPVRYMPTLMHSTSYVGNPEVLTFSPLLPLLALLPVDRFLRIYFAAHILAGAFGCWLLGRRLVLAPWATLALFALTVLNPWVVQHLAIGYTPHITYALCPLVLALLAAPRFTVGEWLAASLVNGLIVYEGGLHVFDWLNGAIVVFALAFGSRRLLGRVAALLVGSALVCAPKLLAVAQALGWWRRDPLDGVHRLADIYGLLTDGRTDPFRLPQAYGVYSTNLYDGAIYVGLPFVVLIVAALGLAAWRRQRYAVGLVAVTALFGLFAWRTVWPRLAHVVRLADTELYPYRFLFVALVAMIGLVVIELARLVERGGRLRWLPLLLVPTLVATWLRTQEYAAHTRMPVPPDCAAAQLEATIGVPRAAIADDRRPLPTSRDGSAIVIEAHDAQKITLPWLHAPRAPDFAVDGARIVRADLQDGVVLLPTAATIRIAPSSYHFWPVAAAAWLTLIALAFAARLAERRTARSRHDGRIGRPPAS